LGEEIADVPAQRTPAPDASGLPVDPEESEAALIERVRAGDVAAFSGLVHKHLRAAFGIAYHVLQHREDAEDAVQQAFMSALARIDTFDSTRPFGPWFGRVVLNHARSARRARTRVARRQVEPVETLDTSPSASPERSAEDAEIRDRVRAAVATLPERQRLAIQLIDVDGYGAAEVAAMLELSPVTMRWHLMAARRTLRRLLAPLSDSHGGSARKIVKPQPEDRESRDVSDAARDVSDANRRTSK
jgi:RNA polymerase sigma-70 factor (ECF subfamily)